VVGAQPCAPKTSAERRPIVAMPWQWPNREQSSLDGNA